MLKSLKRITYQVLDLDKAKQWYGNVLNSQPIFDTPFASIFKVGDCSLSLVKGKYPLPEHNDRIEVYWDVDDIDNVYQKLLESGASPHTPVRSVLNIKVGKVIDPFGNIIGLTGVDTDAGNRSVENKPSETAMTVAFCRTLASKDEREKIKGPDYLAGIFLTEEFKKIMNDDNSRKYAVQNLISSRLYGYFTARTAFIDSIFLKACKEDIPQIVFLGAGYDTRSYRFQDNIKGTKIFELDIRPTQQKKIADLKNADVKIPVGLSFVEVNFKTDKLEDVLRNAGYDRTQRTLFIWEGVTYYLTEKAINDTLNSIKQNSPAGSTVFFDYLTEKL